jgi:hypothetical protein
MEGLLTGMQKGVVPVERWLRNFDPVDHMDPKIGSNMAKVLQNVVNGVSMIDDMNPTITPVLDLSQVRNEASKIGGIVGTGDHIRPHTSFRHAQKIAKFKNPKHEDKAAEVGSSGGDVNFVQNNYSPAELSTATIYKNTRTQIAIAKEELGVPS